MLALHTTTTTCACDPPTATYMYSSNMSKQKSPASAHTTRVRGCEGAWWRTRQATTQASHDRTPQQQNADASLLTQARRRLQQRARALCAGILLVPWYTDDGCCTPAASPVSMFTGDPPSTITDSGLMWNLNNACITSRSSRSAPPHAQVGCGVRMSSLCVLLESVARATIQAHECSIVNPVQACDAHGEVDGVAGPQ
jgi:hypothetical protein